jgi:GNAT superfamily N-acetyltransferase
MQQTPATSFDYGAVTAADVVELANLRAEAMEESLTRLGRFDPSRARDRFIKSFDLPNTRHLLWNGERVGVIVVKRFPERIVLENLYLYRRAHGRGIGSLALRALCEDADQSKLPVHVVALKDSDAIRFYERFGFVLQQIEDVDCAFVREPRLLRA